MFKQGACLPVYRMKPLASRHGVVAILVTGGCLLSYLRISLRKCVSLGSALISLDAGTALCRRIRTHQTRRHSAVPASREIKADANGMRSKGLLPGRQSSVSANGRKVLRLRLTAPAQDDRAEKKAAYSNVTLSAPRPSASPDHSNCRDGAVSPCPVQSRHGDAAPSLQRTVQSRHGGTAPWLHWKQSGHGDTAPWPQQTERISG